MTDHNIPFDESARCEVCGAQGAFETLDGFKCQCCAGLTPRQCESGSATGCYELAHTCRACGGESKRLSVRSLCAACEGEANYRDEWLADRSAVDE